MPLRETLESLDDEGLDDEGLDDEGLDDEGLLDTIGSILGGPAAAIGNLVGGVLGGGPPRPPLPRVSVSAPGAGVSTATLNTPQGNATLRLPEPVVTRTEFDTGIRRLQDAVNTDTARINTVSKDVDTLRARVASVVTDTQRDVGRLRTALTKHRQANRATFARLRREQSQQNMMNMVVSMMLQNQQQTQFAGHTHPETGTTTGEPTGTTNGGDSSSTSMMLPVVMMMSAQPEGSADSSNMMLPLAMMMMFK